MALSSLPTHCRSDAQAVVREWRTSRQPAPLREAIYEVFQWPIKGRVPVGGAGRRPYIELLASAQEAKRLAERHRIEYKAYRPHSALIRTGAAKGGTSTHAPAKPFQEKLLACIRFNHANA